MQAHLQRIQEVNPQLNALVTVDAEQALADARGVDAALSRGRFLPLAGVPFSVKDIIATSGIRTTWGSRVLANHVPGHDATAVARIRRAGGIVIGKSNCPEFGLDLQTSNDLFGTTRSPLDPDLTPGGSSGGDSAAVASGCASAGLGTDYGGSIRWPAQCTAIVGVRPTPGLVPGTGQQPASELTGPNPFSVQGVLQVIGPLARTVDDAELILRVISGADDYDATSALFSGMEAEPDATTAVGTLAGDGCTPVRQDLAHLVDAAARTLEDMGLRTEPVAPGLLTGANAVFTRLRALEGYSTIRAVAGRDTNLLTQAVQSLLRDDRPATVDDYLAAMAARERIRASVMDQLGRTSILLLPVSALPAFEVGTKEFSVQGQDIGYWDVLAPSRAISLLGLPAASVPFGRGADGSPLSVQVVGRPFCEREVLAVARALEVARPPLQDEAHVTLGCARRPTGSGWHDISP